MTYALRQRGNTCLLASAGKNAHTPFTHTRAHAHAEHAGGHNGLCAAAYLARGGRSVCVLERRHVLGGAAVTEEIIPGFKFSRVSE
jgi:hypothetical protein